MPSLDGVASLLCESPEGRDHPQGEVCAEVCLAELHLPPSSFFTITDFAHAWLSGEGT